MHQIKSEGEDGIDAFAVLLWNTSWSQGIFCSCHIANSLQPVCTTNRMNSQSEEQVIDINLLLPGASTGTGAIWQLFLLPLTNKKIQRDQRAAEVAADFNRLKHLNCGRHLHSVPKIGDRDITPLEASLQIKMAKPGSPSFKIRRCS